MPGKNSAEAVIGANGTVRVAPVGTAQPATIDAAFVAGWVDLGYVSEDGFTWSNPIDIASHMAWQSFYPIRRAVNTRDLTIGFSLEQWNSDTLKFAFGGGTVSTLAAGVRYTPPAPETIDERALAIDWADGSTLFRLIIPRGLVTELGDVQATRSGLMLLPVTFSLIGPATGDPWLLQTNAAGVTA